MTSDHRGDRVVVIQHVFDGDAECYEARGTDYYARGNTAPRDETRPAAAVAARTAGEAAFRAHFLWQDGCHSVHLAEVAPGDRKALHRHVMAETIWVIIDGEGEFYPDPDTVIPIKAGMICHAYPKQWHGLGNTGAVPLRYLVVEGPFYREEIEFAE